MSSRLFGAAYPSSAADRDRPNAPIGCAQPNPSEIDLELASWYESLVGSLLPASVVDNHHRHRLSYSRPNHSQHHLVPLQGGWSFPMRTEPVFCVRIVGHATIAGGGGCSCGLEPFSAACIYRSSPSLRRVVPITSSLGHNSCTPDDP